MIYFLKYVSKMSISPGKGVRIFLRQTNNPTVSIAVDDWEKPLGTHTPLVSSLPPSPSSPSPPRDNEEFRKQRARKDFWTPFSGSARKVKLDILSFSYPKQSIQTKYNALTISMMYYTIKIVYHLIPCIYFNNLLSFLQTPLSQFLYY